MTVEIFTEFSKRKRKSIMFIWNEQKKRYMSDEPTTRPLIKGHLDSAKAVLKDGKDSFGRQVRDTKYMQIYN